MIAIYARQSVEKEGSISIETQLSICKGYAGEDSIAYVDRGFSGKNLNRPELARLLGDIRDGKYTAVYVYKLDRISRSLYDFTGLMEFFAKCRVRFVSCTEWFDTKSPMGRAMLSMAATFAQLERETISQRVQDVYAKRSRTGVYMGGRIPLGYRLGDGELLVEKEESCLVRDIFSAYVEAGSYREVADRLNREGRYTRRGKAFLPARIGEILRNPVYVRAGQRTLSYGKSEGIEFVFPDKAWEKKGFYQYGKKKDLWVGAPHEGIIPEELFLRAQLVRKKRFGEALRIAQEHLDSKNFYAFNPEMDT